MTILYTNNLDTVSSIPINYKEFSNISIWPVDGTLTDTTTLSLSGSGSNDNEELTIVSPKCQNWSLTTGCSLLSYLGQKSLYSKQIKSKEL